MSVNFASVIFLKDKVKQTVPIEFIKTSKKKDTFFDPQHVLDYDQEKTYYVKWFFCGVKGSKCRLLHKHDYEYYAASIFCLSETRESLQENKTYGSRKKFATKRLASYETSTEADHESDDLETPERNCSVVLVKKNLAKRVKIENSRQIWNEYMLNRTEENKNSDTSNVRPSLIRDTVSIDSSCSETPRKQSARKTLKNILPEQLNIVEDYRGHQGNQEKNQTPLRTAFDEEFPNDIHPYDEYFTENGSLQDDHEDRSPGDVLNSRLNSEERQEVDASSSEQSESEPESFEVPYTIQGDFYDLAGHKKVNRLSYDAVISRPLIHRKKVLRGLAKILFGENKLVRRCLQIDSISQKTKEKFKVKPIEPEKLDYLQRLYRDYLRNKNIPEDLFKKTYWPEARGTLRYYIRDLRNKATCSRKSPINE